MISFLLALAMILSMLPANALSVFAAEEDGWYWVDDTLYVKDGKILEKNLYAAILEIHGESVSGIKYATSKPDWGWVSGGTELSDSSTTVLSLSGSYVAGCKGTNRFDSYVNATDVDFTVVSYYSLSTSVSGAEGTVTISNVSPVLNETVSITVTNVEGYTPSATYDGPVTLTQQANGSWTGTITATKSGTVAVTYNSNAAEKFNVTIKTEGLAGCGTATLKSESSLIEGAEALVEVTLTPNTNSIYYYVESVKVGETALSTNANGYYVYTMGAEDAEIVVTFAKRELANTGVTLVNYYAGMTPEALKNAIFTALINSGASLPTGITVNDVIIQYYPYQDKVSVLGGDAFEGKHSDTLQSLDYATNTVDSDHALGQATTKTTYYAFGARWLSDSTAKEKVRVTGTGNWDGLYYETEITLGDTRTDADIQVNSGTITVPLNGFYNNKEAGLADRIYNAIVTSNGGHSGAWTLEVYDSGTISGWYKLDNANWNGIGMSFTPGQTKTVRISWAGNGTYKPESIEATVKLEESRTATEITWPSQVTFDNAADLNAAAVEAIRNVLDIRGGATKDQVSITVTFPEGAVLTNDQFVDATVTISVEGTEAYQAYAEKTQTVKVKVNVYCIKWLDAEGNLLETDGPFVPGEQPLEFNQSIPALPENTAQFTYSHGWDVDGDGVADELGTVTITNADVAIKALQIATTNSYTVTWKNWNGDVLDTDTVKYGGTPAYTGNTPQKNADAQYTYVWSGWDKTVTDVTGDVTYTATFSGTTNSYTVTWKNWNGDVLDTDTVDYGGTPAYSGATPTKNTGDGITWEFTGWTPTISSVTGDVTYTATFAKNRVNVTIVWGNGSENTVQGVEYNSAFAQPTAPVREGYRFGGWIVPEGFVFGETQVTEPITLTATWVKVWTVTYQDGSAVLHTVTVDEDTLVNTLLSYTSAKEFYIFNGWTVAGGVETVKADLVLTANWLADTDKDGVADGTAQDPYFDIVYDFGDKGSNTVYQDQLNFNTATFVPGTAPYTVATFNPTGFVFGGWQEAKAEGEGTANITITYTAIWEADTNGNGVADKNETLSFVISGNGSVIIDGKEYKNGDQFVYDSTGHTTYTMVVTPSATAANSGVVNYVGSFSGLTLTEGAIASNTTEAQTVKFTNGVAAGKTVTIAFAQRTLNASNGQVFINKYTGSQGLNGLRTDILTSVGLNPADGYVLTVTVEGVAVVGTVTATIYDDGVFYKTGLSLGDDRGTDITGLFETAMEGKSTMGVEITLPATESLPAVTKSVLITINDSRTVPTVELGNIFDGNNHATIEAGSWPTDFKTWIDVNGYTGDWSVTVTPATAPAEGAEGAAYTIHVALDGNVNFQPATHTFQVTVDNPKHPVNLTWNVFENAQIQIWQGEQQITSNFHQLPAGTYTVKVIPQWSNGYYVDAVSVESGDGTLSDGAWNAGVYTATLVVNNGIDAINEVKLNVKIAKREILLNEKNDTANGRYQQPYMSWSLEGVFALVNGSEEFVYADGAIALNGTAVPNALNTFVLTWAGDDKYPEVTTSVEVYLTNELVSPGLTVNNGTFVVEENHVGADNTLNDAAKEAIAAYLKTLVDATAWDDAVINLSYDLGSTQFVQGTTVTVKVTASIEKSDEAGYLAQSEEFTLTLTGKVEQWVIHSNAGTINGGSMIVSEPDADGKVTITMTPALGYFESGLKLRYNRGSYTDIEDYSFTVADGTGLTLGVVPEYEVDGIFAEATITVPATGEMNYYVGMDMGDANLTIKAWDAIKNDTIFAPESMAVGGVIYYLARPSGSYPISLTLNLGPLGNYVINEEIPMPELWLQIGEEFPTDLAQPSQDEIQAIAMELIDGMSLEELKNLYENEAARNEFLKELLNDPDNAELLEYVTYYGAHQFGKNDVFTAEGYRTEIIRVEAPFANSQSGKVISNNCTLTLTDTRAVTEIKLNNPSVTLPYGFTDAQLLAALGVQIMAGDNPVSGVVQVVTDLSNMGASDTPYIVTLEFAGDETYRDCAITATVTVVKATVELNVDNRLLKWQQGLTYANPVSTIPAGVDTIVMIAGLNISDLNLDGSIKGLMGEVQLLIPESYMSLLAMAGLKEDTDLTLEQLKELLLKILELTGVADSQDETVATLLNMLESLPTDIANVRIRLGGELPTDIGVYAVAGITADANYETAFGVGAIVITPDGKKAELAWNQTDSNFIITRSLLVNGLFDLGAHVTEVYDAGAPMGQPYINEAQAQLVELYLGVDVDGNLIMQTQQTALNVGAYVEVALIANFGNEMYYAEPLVRPIVVLPELVDLDFVDASGTVNDDRKFTFDNQAHPLEGVLVSEKDGTVLVNTLKGQNTNGGELLVYYAGISTNVKPVFSQEAPVHAGAYMVIGVYIERDDMGMVTRMGVGEATMVILPAESDVTVDNQIEKYHEGIQLNTEGMIHASSAVPGITPDVTIVTAGLRTDGSFSELGLKAIYGNVNADLPDWLDELMKEYGILEAGYTDAGITKEALLYYVDRLESILTDNNLSVDAISGLVDMVEQLPENTTITFKNQSELIYSDVGIHLVVAVVTDSDHYPSMDAGLLIIYPDAIEAELKFNKTWDDDNVFTWDYLQTYDMGATAYVPGTDHVDSVANTMVKNIYVGFTVDGKLVLSDSQADLEVGVYTQTSLVLDTLDSQFYYAEPISRTVVVVPNKAIVEIEGSSDADNVIKEEYDGNAHDLKVEVFVNGQLVQNPGSDLKLNYIGADSTGTPYSSTVAPVNAGVYVLTALYIYRNEEGKLTTTGAGVATLIIEPAKASIDVENEAMKYDGVTSLDTESLIHINCGVAGKIPQSTIITAMLNTDGSFAENGLSAIQGAVNVDLPVWLDEKLSEDAKSNGLTVAAFIRFLDKVESKLEELGIDSKIFESLRGVVSQLPSGAAITFHEQAEIAPKGVGTYLIIGLVTDPNFYPTMDAGLAIIYPDATKTELQWIYQDQNNIYTLELLKKINMGAQATADADLDVKTLYLGVDVNQWKVVLLDSQDQLHNGVYTEFAFLNEKLDSQFYYAVPISRPVIVVPNAYQVDFYDGNKINNDRLYMFDNTGKDMGGVVIHDMDGNPIVVDPANLTITYVGADTTPGLYNSSEKPVHVGTYTVIATYAVMDGNGLAAAGVGMGTLIISPADVALNVESQVIPYGKDYTINIEAIHGAVGENPNLLTIIAGLDVADVSTNGALGIDGLANIDMPAKVDEIFKTLVPEWYENGIGTEAFKARINELQTALNEHGYSSELLTRLLAYVDSVNAVNLTFRDDYKPTNAGVYGIITMTMDPDYKPAADTALLVITPDVAVMEAKFDMAIPGALNILHSNDVAAFDFGAHADILAGTGSEVESDYQMKNIIFGLDSHGRLVYLDAETEKPSEVGIYDQLAYVDEKSEANLKFIGIPDLRAFSVVLADADIQFVGTGAYNTYTYTYGDTMDITAQVVDSEGNALPYEPILYYFGVNTALDGTWSTTMPTDAGVYTVAGYYFNESENVYTIGFATLIIEKASNRFGLLDLTTPYNGQPQWPEVINEFGVDSLFIVVDATNKSANLILEDDTEAIRDFLELLGIDLSNGIEGVDVQIDAVKAGLNKLLTQNLIDLPEIVTEQLTDLQTVLADLDNSSKLIINGQRPVDAGEYYVYNIAISQNYEMATAQAMLEIKPITIVMKPVADSKVYGEADPELRVEISYYSYFGKEYWRSRDLELGTAPTFDPEKYGSNWFGHMYYGIAGAPGLDGTIYLTDPVKVENLTLPEGISLEDILEYQVNRAKGEDVGDYVMNITCDLLDSVNYAVVWEPGINFTIEKAPLTITANGNTITYGQAPAANGVTYAGFVNGEDASVLEGTLSYTYSYSQFGDVGSYSIDPEGLTSGNYEITYKSGVLTVVHGYELGDVNHDGKVNSLDASLIMQYKAELLGEEQVFCKKCADVNGDGKINSLDASLIMQLKAGLIEQFPIA